MKFLILFSALLGSVVTHAEGDDFGPPPAEVKFCEKRACFSQTVIDKLKILEVGKETVETDSATGDVFLRFSLKAKREFKPGKFIENDELTISQWIGNGTDRVEEHERNVRAFVDALKKASASGKEINVVVVGASSEMVAKFPIVGFFTNDGRYFFLERAAAPANSSEG